jgi:hypothetical protein
MPTAKEKQREVKEVKTVILATRVTPDIYDALAREAKENFRSVAAEILAAIHAHLVVKGRLRK